MTTHSDAKSETRDDRQRTRDWVATARTLSEALPFLQRYERKIVVIKYGGHAMGDAERSREFARDIVLMKQVGINPIVVHGGGPQIGEMLERLRIQSTFVDGLRVTDEAIVDVVEMVLAGSINKQIVTAINGAGGKAVGLCGKDGNLVRAKKLLRTKKDPESNIEKVIDLGFVGEPDQVNPAVLEAFFGSDIIPVIAPIGVGANGETFNINADTVAGAIAAAVGAMRLLLLTDVPGVKDKDGHVIPEMTQAQAEAAIADGTVTGGMIPKLETCIDAARRGVEAVVILDGRVPHAVLLELFTEHGAGTLIRRTD